MPPPLQRYAANGDHMLQSYPAPVSHESAKAAKGGNRSCSKCDFVGVPGRSDDLPKQSTVRFSKKQWKTTE
jgi:hypothetical protein